MANRGKMRQVTATNRSQNVVKPGSFTTVGKTVRIAENRSLEYLKNRRFTFMKNDYSTADEQAAAEAGRMLLWQLLHHQCNLEFIFSNV